jgi:pimeloyl-ACP methyl ester carboxylesterase
MSRCLALPGVLLLVGTTLLAEAARDGKKSLVLSDCLVLRSGGRPGRSAIHTDAVEADLVAGRWKAPPRVGDKVALPGEAAQTWQAATTGKDGVLIHEALSGGYVYWKVPADTSRILLLEASGHTMVYVNGEPRTGDPYSSGIVRLPVRLHQGDNDLLFQCSRGRLQARLVEPPAPVFLDTRDATLPDFTGESEKELLAALVVVNADDQPRSGLTLRAVCGDGDPVETPVPALLPLGTRKVGFAIRCRPPATTADKLPVRVELTTKGDGKPLASAAIDLGVRRPGQGYKATFRSEIDGSVQYYAVRPQKLGDRDDRPPALFLSLHGAGVEAIGQVNAYSSHASGPIVAPTNRRPFGFDWEDWGRFDALEVLDLARKELKTDPRRTYLTGHSMGGHGTWHLGATYPDRWAAIAPSAGWVSFATYTGDRPPADPTPARALLLRAASAGDPLALAKNYARLGVYVLHGDQDEYVPVGEARTMRKALAEFHPDFAYYERPGARHWWGNECVDWPPLFEFLERHTLPKPDEVRQVQFVTASPGVSAWCHWAGIEEQVQAFRPSTVNLRFDPDRRRFDGTTENVARLALDLTHVKPGQPLHAELDGQKLDDLAWPEKTPRLWFRREAGKWAATGEPPASLKGPHRSGPFKDAFRNRMAFVYGTRGTAEENARALAKARLDAETFWYRGNGSVDVLADTAFDADKDRDRNVILYGHAESNAAWQPLLGDSPVQVHRGFVQIGERKESGDDLACLFVRPRPGSGRASVGVVGGTGVAGQRLTERLAYFVSGTGWPDCLVLGPEMLTKGAEGVRAAGFFGADWGVASGEFVWGP